MLVETSGESRDDAESDFHSEWHLDRRGSRFIQMGGPGDLGDGTKKAFAEFRSQFPKLSLLDHGMVVRFAKMEEPSMGGARPARARKRKK